MKSRGVFYMTLSALGFSVMSVLVKETAPHLPMGEIVLARVLMTLALSYLMVKRTSGRDGKPLSPWGNERRKLVLRGVLGFGGLACYYLALGRLPLADATTLQNIQPLITALLAWWILDEKVGWAAAIAIACGIAGVVAVVHPGMGAVGDPVGTGIAVGSAAMSALAYVTVRQLSKTEHPLVIVFYFPLVSVPLALPWAAADFVTPTARDWALLVAIGIATQVGQVFLTMALTVERAGRATSVGYIQICFAMIWQLLLFDQAPALGTVAGAALIIGGTVVVSATARRDAPPPRTATSPPP